MATVFDAARYILCKLGPISSWKLQKLVYYCQAWSLVWDEAPLFDEKIEAWANGPVCPKLFQQHKNCYTVNEDMVGGNVNNLSNEQKDTIDAVLNFYGEKPGYYLRELTHQEDPWKLAREGLEDGERGNTEISHESMLEYYGAL